jgi:hypothetical protein
MARLVKDFDPSYLQVLATSLHEDVILTFDKPAEARAFQLQINLLKAQLRAEGHYQAERYSSTTTKRNGCQLTVTTQSRMLAKALNNVNLRQPSEKELEAYMDAMSSKPQSKPLGDTNATGYEDFFASVKRADSGERKAMGTQEAGEPKEQDEQDKG